MWQLRASFWIRQRVPTFVRPWFGPHQAFVTARAHPSKMASWTAWRGESSRLYHTVPTVWGTVVYDVRTGHGLSESRFQREREREREREGERRREKEREGERRRETGGWEIKNTERCTAGLAFPPWRSGLPCTEGTTKGPKEVWRSSPGKKARIGSEDVFHGAAPFASEPFEGGTLGLLGTTWD